MQPLHNESKHRSSFLGFHPTIYGKRGIFAIAKIFRKNICPGNGSFARKYGVAGSCFL
jgi:hypothetical protein